jgi:hypothetical protein
MNSSQSNRQPGDTSHVLLRQRHKFSRSRDGCITCKYDNRVAVSRAKRCSVPLANHLSRQRKVKCDESRPRCSHCERLNIECRWRNTSRGAVYSRQSGTTNSADRMPVLRTPVSASPSTDNPSNPSPFQFPGHQSVTEIFDYASFIYDGRDAWQQMALDVERAISFDSQPVVSPFKDPRDTICLHHVEGT